MRASIKRSRVLLVTYHFPPSGGVGVQRVLSYCKYLSRFGHEVFVVAPRSPLTHVYDPELMNVLPPEARILRAWNPEIPWGLRDYARQLCGHYAGARQPQSPAAKASGPSLRGRLMERISFPDPQKVWAPFALRRAAQAIREHAIDTVLVTVPPFSCLRVGIELKRRFPSIRLINDFRDEWIDYTLREHKRGAGSFSISTATNIEREAVRAADFTIAVTESWRSLIRERHPEEPASKFLCIPNGYDPDEIPAPAPAAAGNEGKLVICYAGTIDSNPVYSARNFFTAAAGLSSELRSQLEVRIAGRVERRESEFIAGCPVDVRQFGFLPRREALAQVANGDCALLLVNTRDAHSGKVFEYFALGKPVLALTTPGGELDRLIRNCQAGWSVDGNNVGAIQAALEAVVAMKRRQTAVWPRADNRVVGEFSRARLIQRMAMETGLGCPTAMQGV